MDSKYEKATQIPFSAFIYFACGHTNLYALEFRALICQLSALAQSSGIMYRVRRYLELTAWTTEKLML